MFTYGALNIAHGHRASVCEGRHARVQASLRHAKRAMGSVVVPPSLDEIPPTTQEMHVVDGYLHRRGRHLKSWRRRYFLFEDGILVHKRNDEPTARVVHEDRVFDVLYWSGRPHGLCLKLRGERVVFLTARSEEDAARWHDTIESYLTEQRCVVDLRRALCRGRLPSIRESVSELARAD